MSTTITEHLSAVLDGEAGEFEQRRLLDELGKDNDLQASLACYALIGETMRDEKQAAIADSSFLAAIHDAIDAEPEYSHVEVIEKKVSNGSPTWIRPVTGFAMAASVAAIAFIGVQSSFTLSGGSSERPLATNQQVESTPTMVANIYEYPDKKTRTLYKRYMDSHAQYASTTPMIPSLRVVSYNADY
jgi:negative regulator of sigma E activity